MPDPWGVRRAENLLTSLEGILSARVVTTPLGEVSEIHVLAQAGLAPKQIVRNIESRAAGAARPQGRSPEDQHRADGGRAAASRRWRAEAVRERALHRAILFENLTVAPGRRPHRITITVTLSFRGQVESAEEESSDTPRSRVEAAAKAAVGVLDRLLTDQFGGARGRQDRGGVRP